MPLAFTTTPAAATAAKARAAPTGQPKAHAWRSGCAGFHCCRSRSKPLGWRAARSCLRYRASRSLCLANAAPGQYPAGGYSSDQARISTRSSSKRSMFDLRPAMSRQGASIMQTEAKLNVSERRFRALQLRSAFHLRPKMGDNRWKKNAQARENNVKSTQRTRIGALATSTTVADDCKPPHGCAAGARGSTSIGCSTPASNARPVAA